MSGCKQYWEYPQIHFIVIYWLFVSFGIFHESYQGKKKTVVKITTEYWRETGSNMLFDLVQNFYRRVHEKTWYQADLLEILWNMYWRNARHLPKLFGKYQDSAAISQQCYPVHHAQLELHFHPQRELKNNAFDHCFVQYIQLDYIYYQITMSITSTLTISQHLLVVMQANEVFIGLNNQHFVSLWQWSTGVK